MSAKTEAAAEPFLPESRGELSTAVLARLRGNGARRLPGASHVRKADPYGEDLQLALYACYELHYRGFSGVDSTLEWDPDLLRLRGELEHRFLSELRDEATRHRDVQEALESILVEPVKGVGATYFLKDRGELWQLREYAAQRSLYHLKEADPHAWVIPRLRGRAKAAMVAVEYDEFGGGRAERVHARLFADLMRDLDLDPTYGCYLDAAGPQALATVNLMSLFGTAPGIAWGTGRALRLGGGDLLARVPTAGAGDGTGGCRPRGGVLLHRARRGGRGPRAGGPAGGHRRAAGRRTAAGRGRGLRGGRDRVPGGPAERTAHDRLARGRQ